MFPQIVDLPNYKSHSYWELRESFGLIVQLVHRACNLDLLQMVKSCVYRG